MKKIILSFWVMFFCVFISAQKYEQYKREKEYSQRYRKEQQKQFNITVNKLLSSFTVLTNKYVSLVVQRKSISYVNKHYPDLKTKRDFVHNELLNISNKMSNSQLNIFQYNVSRFNVLYNSYNN